MPHSKIVIGMYEALMLMEILKSYCESEPCEATTIAVNLRNCIIANMAQILAEDNEWLFTLNLNDVDVIDDAIEEYAGNNDVDSSIFNDSVFDVFVQYFDVLGGIDFTQQSPSEVSGQLITLSKKVNYLREGLFA